VKGEREEKGRKEVEKGFGDKFFGQKPFRLSVYRQPQDEAQQRSIQLED